MPTTLKHSMTCSKPQSFLVEYLGMKLKPLFFSSASYYYYSFIVIKQTHKQNFNLL